MKESCTNGCSCGGSGACDCCAGVNVLTPVKSWNRPGLEALVYRVGAHGSFFETMQAHLSSSQFAALSGLTTRERADFSLALLDAWATVGDVLTFYQERIANEGYLRTATERRSVLELARLVGYRLKPGVAASVYLAFTLEPTQTSVVIEPGNKTQSAPGPGELPQVFETAERLEARARFNLIKPLLTQPQHLFIGASGKLKKWSDTQLLAVELQGAPNNLSVNDLALLRFLVGGIEKQFVFQIAEIQPAPAAQRTTVWLRLHNQNLNTALVALQLAFSITLPFFAALDFNALRKRFTPANFELSETKSKPVARVWEALGALNSQNIPTVMPRLRDEYAAACSRGNTKQADWMRGIIEALEEPQVRVESERPEPVPTTLVNLLAPFKLPPSQQPANAARLTTLASQVFAQQSAFIPQSLAALNPQILPYVSLALINAPQQPPADATGDGVVWITGGETLKVKAALTGASLLPFTKLNAQGAPVLVPQPTLGDYIAALGKANFNKDGNGDLRHVALAAEYNQIKPGSSLAIELPTAGPPAGFLTTIHQVATAKTATLLLNDLPLKVTVLTLNQPWLTEAAIHAQTNSNAVVVNTTVYADGAALPLAEQSVETNIEQDGAEIELDGAYHGLEAGRWVILSGARLVPDKDNNLINSGVVVSELLMLSHAEHQAQTLVNGKRVAARDGKLRTFVRFATAPAFSYKRDTVKLHANVVRATHGETKSETLGSGDGSQSWQAFALRQPPLTYLAAPTSAGADSTLEVRVNDVRWREAENLFALEPTSRNYVTKTDDEGKTSIVFGNGERGARLPTDAENVTARYRSGIGQPGNVKAEQIKLLMTRPQGVKGVINPLPASGGADRETRDQARRNAPLGVLALDRLVSTQDYADFARTFAGIGKAHAQRLSDGLRQVVHLSIAGAGDIPLDATSDLYRNLQAALKRFGDPFQPLVLQVYERVLLVIHAKVALHPDYLWEKVKPQIVARLFDRFGFASRELGQDVTQSEIVSAIQAVSGVIASDLELLDTIDEAKLSNPNFANQLSLRPRVVAQLARRKDQTSHELRPAQLAHLSALAAQTIILEEATQ